MVRSIAKVKFKSITLRICKILRLKIILGDLQIKQKGPMRLYHDNKTIFNIVYYPVQHDITKHVEVNRHFIKEKLSNMYFICAYKWSSCPYFNKRIAQCSLLESNKQAWNERYPFTSLKESVYKYNFFSYLGSRRLLLFC